MPLSMPFPTIRLPRTSTWLPTSSRKIPTPGASISLPLIRTPLAPNPSSGATRIPSRSASTASSLLSSTRRPSNVPRNTMRLPLAPATIVLPLTVTS
jgi:hypothetical protein